MSRRTSTRRLAACAGVIAGSVLGWAVIFAIAVYLPAFWP